METKRNKSYCNLETSLLFCLIYPIEYTSYVSETVLIIKNLQGTLDLYNLNNTSDFTARRVGTKFIQTFLCHKEKSTAIHDEVNIRHCVTSLASSWVFNALLFVLNVIYITKEFILYK